MVANSLLQDVEMVPDSLLQDVEMVPKGIVVPDSQPLECEEENEDDDDGIDGLLTTKQVRNSMRNARAT